MPFELIAFPQNLRLSAVTVSVTNKGNRRSACMRMNVSVPLEIAQAARLIPGQKAAVLLGTGSDAGQLLLRPPLSGEDGFLVRCGASRGAHRRIEFRVPPALSAERRHATPAASTIQDGALLVTLPPEIVLPTAAVDPVPVVEAPHAPVEPPKLTAVSDFKFPPYLSTHIKVLATQGVTISRRDSETWWWDEENRAITASEIIRRADFIRKSKVRA